MHTTANPQLGRLDSWMTATSANNVLAGPDRKLDCKPLEAALQAVYAATSGHPPCAPLMHFKMGRLQYCGAPRLHVVCWI